METQFTAIVSVNKKTNQIFLLDTYCIYNIRHLLNESNYDLAEIFTEMELIDKFKVDSGIYSCVFTVNPAELDDIQINSFDLIYKYVH